MKQMQMTAGPPEKMQFTSLDIKKSNQVTAKEGIGFSVAFRVQEQLQICIFAVPSQYGRQAVGTSVSEGIGAFAKNTSASVGIHFDTTSLTKGDMWQSWRPWNRWAAEDSGGMPGWNMPLRLKLQKMHLDSTA
mgnify:CR=1 FL=1